MLTALAKLLKSRPPREIFDRAGHGDPGFFRGQYVPMAAKAVHARGVDIVLLRQRLPVAHRDMSHAAIALSVGKLRVFGVEVHRLAEGNLHFFVEAEPFASVAAQRPRSWRYRHALMTDDPERDGRIVLEDVLDVVAPRATDAPDGPLRLSCREPRDDFEHALLLDLHGDLGAAQRWRELATSAPRELQPILLGHAAAATARLGTATTEHEIASVIASLGPRPEPAMLAAVLSAIGYSLDASHVAYLAQAAWLIWRATPDFTHASVALLSRLLDRVALDAPVARYIAAIGVARGRRHPDAAVARGAMDLATRVGVALGTYTPLAPLMETMLRDRDDIEPALRELADGVPWLAGSVRDGR